MDEARRYVTRFVKSRQETATLETPWSLEEFWVLRHDRLQPIVRRQSIFRMPTSKRWLQAIRGMVAISIILATLGDRGEAGVGTETTGGINRTSGKMMTTWSSLKRDRSLLFLWIPMVQAIDFRFPGRRGPHDDINENSNNHHRTGSQEDFFCQHPDSSTMVMAFQNNHAGPSKSSSSKSSLPKGSSATTTSATYLQKGAGNRFSQLDAAAESLAHRVADAVNQAAMEAERAVSFRQWLRPLQRSWHAMYDHLCAVLLYQPPVGIVTIWAISRLLWSGRLLGRHPHHQRRRWWRGGSGGGGGGGGGSLSDASSTDDALFLAAQHQQGHRRERMGRAVQLDPDDRAYLQSGGVDLVRAKLCHAALTHLLVTLPQQQYQQWRMSSTSTSRPDSKLPSHFLDGGLPPMAMIQAAQQGLQVVHVRGTSRVHLVQAMAPFLAQLEQQYPPFRTLARSESPALVEPVQGHGSGWDSSSLRQSEQNTDTRRRRAQNSSTRNDRQGGTKSSSVPTSDLGTSPLFEHSNEGDPVAMEQSKENVDRVVQIAAMTAQLRAIDALLRICRDRLLQSSHRVARTREHWERRLQNNHGRWNTFWDKAQQTLLRPVVGREVSSTNEANRMRLSMAQAAYKAETGRLGLVAAMLMQRPADLEETCLLQAARIRSGSASLDISSQNPTNIPGTPLLSWFSRIPRFTIRPAAPGKGFVSIQRLDPTDMGGIEPGPISGSRAMQVLFLSHEAADRGKQRRTNTYNDNGHQLSDDVWLRSAQSWTQSSRRVLCQVVRESLENSDLPSSSSKLGLRREDFVDLEKRWCGRNDNVAAEDGTTDLWDLMDNGIPGSERMPAFIPNSKSTESLERDWKSMLRFVDQLPSWRRIGEARSIRLSDAAIVDWTRQLDFRGIPSTLLYIWLAHKIHQWAMPQWPRFRQEAVDVVKKLFEILYTRFWVPFKGIFDDIMNKSPGMMSAFGLDIEEGSLDHMLHDLGFGDGTPATRRLALQLATEQYEHDLRSGLLSNFLRGRLVRLLLVQVQQLKVGLLSALDTIDVLMTGNRIHFQVLAAIPAAVMATYGTRLFVRTLYNIRAQDLRPITAVHTEMGKYLANMEQLILLSDPPVMTTARVLSNDDKGFDEIKRSGTNQDHWFAERDFVHSNIPLKPTELGEWLLHMHRYLMLLDFGSPPFPTVLCDQIHQSLQAYGGPVGVMQRQLGAERLLLWLDRIQQKHNELLKHS